MESNYHQYAVHPEESTKMNQNQQYRWFNFVILILAGGTMALEIPAVILGFIITSENLTDVKKYITPLVFFLAGLSVLVLNSLLLVGVFKKKNLFVLLHMILLPLIYIVGLIFVLCLTDRGDAKLFYTLLQFLCLVLLPFTTIKYLKDKGAQKSY